MMMSAMPLPMGVMMSVVGFVVIMMMVVVVLMMVVQEISDLFTLVKDLFGL